MDSTDALCTPTAAGVSDLVSMGLSNQSCHPILILATKSFSGRDIQDFAKLLV